MKLIIQIPCFDEESTLPGTLADLPREVPGFDVVEWLVVDDGSTDGTVEVARRLGVDHVVRVPENRGLANAFLTGIAACLERDADVIVNTDADNQYQGSCIPDLVAPVVAGLADVVVGERPIESVDEFSPMKKRLQRLGSWAVRGFSGTGVRDAASGFRAFDREAALRIQVFGRFSYTMETIVQAGWEGLRITSVPIRVNAKTRESRLVRSIPSYIWRSGTTIVRSFALYKPLRFFFLVGLLPLVGSLALVLRYAYIRAFTDDVASRVPSLVAATLLFLVAGQLWMFGMLADLLSANRRMIAAIRLDQRRAVVEAARDDRIDRDRAARSRVVVAPSVDPPTAQGDPGPLRRHDDHQDADRSGRREPGRRLHDVLSSDAGGDRQLGE